MSTQDPSKTTALPSSQEEKSAQISGLASSIISGTVVALIGLAGTYWINLEQIEKPKILLEQKKTLLEAHKQILSLAPKIETDCDRPERWSATAWRVLCRNKNIGVYPTTVQINTVTIGSKSNPAAPEMLAPKDFQIYYLGKKRSYVNPAGTPAGVLQIFLIFEDKKYQDATLFNDMKFNIEFQYFPSESASQVLAETFPDQERLIKDVANQIPEVISLYPEVPLPPEASNATQ